MRKQLHLGMLSCALVAGMLSYAQSTVPVNPRIIELTAGHDSRYRLRQKVGPTIEVYAGEPLILRVMAVRAETVARDGSIHGLALLDKNSEVVPGWKFLLHPGVQDLPVSAPSQPGRYTAVCTVICSDAHEGMDFTLVVTERTAQEKE
jgi:hypothetical protein